MSPFLDDDEFEIARRLRRVAGPTPDVYVAYDTVLDHVGAVRRRRRLAVSGTSVVAIFAMGGMYVLNLQEDGRTLRYASPTSAVESSTTYVLDVLVRPTAVATTTTSTSTTIAAPETSVAAIPAVTEPTATAAPTADAVAAETPAPSPTPAPAPPATAKRRPPSAPPATEPPATEPPATEAPVETAPPETTPSTEVAPTAAPETTTPPPSTPDTTAPPPTAPPLATTPGQPVPEPTTGVATQSFTDAYGNSGSVSYVAGHLQFGQVQAANGWEAETATFPSDTRAVITFAAKDGSARSVITAMLDGDTIRIG